MFILCDSMRWNHLPVSGGLYDQDPYLLDCFQYMFMKRSEREQKEAKEQERKSKRPARK